MCSRTRCNSKGDSLLLLDKTKFHYIFGFGLRNMVPSSTSLMPAGINAYGLSRRNSVVPSPLDAALGSVSTRKSRVESMRGSERIDAQLLALGKSALWRV